MELRELLLKFIGEFANWDHAANAMYLEIGRGLVKAAPPEETPVVVDPFAGGGSIPLEALRLGCETFASDLNPVACLILKTLLEDIPRYGNAEFRLPRRFGVPALAGQERGEAMAAPNRLKAGLQTEDDFVAVHGLAKRLQKGSLSGISAVPDEPLPWRHGHRALGSPRVYGMQIWGDLFTARQKLARISLGNAVASLDGSEQMRVLREILALAASRFTDICNAFCQWMGTRSQVAHLFTRQALPMLWDFAEPGFLAEQAGDYSVTLDTMVRVIERLAGRLAVGQAQQADACASPLSSGSASVWFTDPPYYDNVAYADLSDFFLVWLKRALPHHSFLRDPFDPTNPLSPKERELTVTTVAGEHMAPKTTEFFLTGMAGAFAEGRRILNEAGIGCVVFAHKTTEGWEALLSGLLHAGWTITASWPISTERANRMVARDIGALAGSVHLVCRPRPADAGVGGLERSEGGDGEADSGMAAHTGQARGSRRGRHLLLPRPGAGILQQI